MKRSNPNLRWLMVGLAFAATTLNYLDRQTLSVTAPVLMDQFRMDHQGYSRVVFLFMLAYTISNGICGPILDRLGTRVGFALTMAWWSAAGMLNGLARGPWSLGIFQFLLGSGEAGNWPASVKVVAEWFPTEERALASGIFNSGSAIGATGAAGGSLASASLRLAAGLCCGGRARIYLDYHLVPALPHPGGDESCRQAAQGTHRQALPHPVCLEFHAVQSAA